ncbi:MAG: SDR family NAD(P)-dependent oxidoreductase [Thaumarchaeota archaeon]|nr:SDR family NAD(P)-dependent oxidoreductase [Nitrososphaerota archaeon]
MHALVTGNTGFIGTQLCKDLLKKGLEVTALSRNQENFNLASLSKDIDTKKLHLVNCDILNETELHEIFNKIGTVNCIFHLAGQTYRKDLSNPKIYFQNNFVGTLNILEICRNFDVKKLVFSSSMAVYGLSINQYAPQYLPVDEKHPIKPYDFYDASKYHAEELCNFYQTRYGIESIVLRYSRVYGPTMGKGLIFQAIKKAISNEQIEVMGDVSTDFVLVDDVLQANISSLEKNFQKMEIFNIGSGEEKSLHWICSTIIDLCHSSSKIIFHQEPKSKFSLDISKAGKMLDYNPTKTKEGLIECINYIKNSIT